MLTAELIKRNIRLNQAPIVEEDDEQQKATLKLKRRISREPNTGKIIILPEQPDTNGPQSPSHLQNRNKSTPMPNNGPKNTGGRI